MKQRLLYGLLVALAVMLAMVFFSGPALFLFLAALVAACQWEFYVLARNGGYRVYDRLGLVLGFVWLAAVYLLAAPHGKPHATVPGWETAFLILICFVTLLRTLRDRKTPRAFESAAVTFLGVFYPAVMLSYYILLAQWDATAAWGTTRAGVFLCLYLSLVVKLSDTGAYFCGMRWGRHKMCPRVSPAKSWEGLCGGLLAGVAAGIAAAWGACRWQWGPEGIFWAQTGESAVMTLGRSALLAVLLVAVGVLGDLIESMFKRSVQVKDSSGIVPGLGGLLDMLDSLVFAVPCMYFFLLWLIP